jgi:hypothetical protein
VPLDEATNILLGGLHFPLFTSEPFEESFVVASVFNSSGISLVNCLDFLEPKLCRFLSPLMLQRRSVLAVSNMRHLVRVWGRWLSNGDSDGGGIGFYVSQIGHKGAERAMGISFEMPVKTLFVCKSYYLAADATTNPVVT